MEHTNNFKQKKEDRFEQLKQNYIQPFTFEGNWRYT